MVRERRVSSGGSVEGLDFEGFPLHFTTGASGVHLTLSFSSY